MHTVGFRVGIAALAAAGLALMSGCNYDPPYSIGGGGGASSGTVSVAVTDAAADEIESFVVDVNAFQLRRQNGAVVNVISAPVTLDLATLTDMAQLLNLLNVQVGIYDSATITFDFTDASCVLVGQNSPATILDSAGSAVTGTLALPVEFGTAPLTVVAGQHHLLELDFDLNQSVTVNSAGNSVTLEPVVALRVDGSGKPLATAGALIGVNVAGLTFAGNVKTLQGIVLGTVTYAAASNTIFQVDGAPATGAAGLALLNTKPAGTWLQVYGEIDPVSSRVKAAYVEAGTGTYNGLKDIVEGHVVDRVGNPPPGSNVQLLVRGRSSNANHTSLQYDEVFTVTTSFSNTKVVRPFSALPFDVDDVNVGQRVRIYGSLSGTSMLATQSNDVVRLQPSRVFGFAGGAIAGSTLTLDLQHIDMRPDSEFTWPNSGSTPPVPTTFTANVGMLGNGLGIANGTAVEVRGFVAAVGDGNEDSTAHALLDLDAAPSLLFVRNQPGGFAVDVTTSASQFEIAITGLAGPTETAIVDHGFAGSVPLPSSPTPIVVPAGPGALCMLRDKATGVVTAYHTFDAFTTALAAALSAGAAIVTIGATGSYDATTNTIQAVFVSVIVE